jgi:hypothetical protein
MADKAAPGMEFASWTSLPEGPLSEILSNAKNMAIGYGIEQSGLKDWLNNSFGKKSEGLPSDYTPSGGVMPPANYGLQAPMQEGFKPPPEYGLQPPSNMAAPFKPFGLPNAMKTKSFSTPQPTDDDHVLTAWGWNKKY